METWVVMAGFLASLAFMAIAKVVNEMWLVPRRLEKHLRRQGLRGNSYRFFYGDLKHDAAMFKQAASKPINISDDIVPRCLPAVHNTLQLHGKNSFSWMGPIPRLFIYNPEQIKEIFVRNYEFVKPNSNPLGKLLATGVATYDGEKWMKHRRVINPAFHLEKLKKMLPAFYVSCSNMVGKWESLVSEKGFLEVDVWPHLVGLTGDVISRTAFGSSYEEGMRIFELQEEQGRLIMEVIRSAYIPGWRFIPTKLNKRMWTIDKEVKALLKTMIDKREKATRKGEAANDDLLGILLESNSKATEEHGDNKNKGMSLEDVMEECKLFYFAGQETTSVLLVWTMVLLSQHPDWQAKAREEVVNVFGKGKPAEVDGLNRLKIVSMILYEVLRLYPPGTFSVRCVHKETQLGDLLVPAGAQVAVPIIFVHHDHKLWGEDAKEFRPERFSDGISKATNNQVSYLPFGWGPRICVGQNFALLEAKMALAMVLQNFSFELSPSYAHAPHSLLTLRPQHGAHLILHKI